MISIIYILKFKIRTMVLKGKMYAKSIYLYENNTSNIMETFI